MAWIVILILIAWPVMEFAAFAQVAQWVGTPLAIVGLFLSAVLGFGILRGQSFSAARKMQGMISQGQLPVRQMFDGAIVALASLLLIIPGYVTDIVGLLLLLPFVRSLIYGEMSLMVRTSVKGRAEAQRQAEQQHDSTIIDADYKVVGQKDAQDDHHHDDGGNYTVYPPNAKGAGGGGSGGSGTGNRPSIRLLL
jgi:UPF0716 protein FxsA